ncbi:MAG: winged helix DNA-binding domain-containing protein [Nitrososphaerota archaeon]
MASATVGLRRLSQQRLTREPLATPVEVVSWLGAVQSQEYQPAQWSLGMRMRDASYDAIERAFNEGAILRTHVLRPTWHFVAPTDIRWLLELTAPRVKAASAYYARQLELDEATFTRSNDIIASALAGGKSLTRAELGQELARAGITAEAQRLGHIVMRAELDAVICSGPRRGKQFTYALLAERAPQAQALPRDEALAALTCRYFTSHGPATERDFAWWSGLTLTDARAGLRMVSADLTREEIDGQTYWSGASALPPADPTHEAFLMPTYDEMLVGYEGFGAALTGGRGNGEWAAFNATIMCGGQVIGNWRRTITKNAAVIEVAPFAPWSDAGREAILAAAGRYGAFFGVSVECVGLS